MNSEQLPESLHFVGVGGIGMSGLAQMCAELGCRVSGSDRALHDPANQRIFDALRAMGISLYPQDGSVYGHIKPDAIVYSTAIEESNPDFIKAPDLPRIHRSQALASSVNALKNKHTIAVTGTCGKTTVSSWLAETLENLGASPGLLGGGLVNAFVSRDHAGNFKNGNGRYFVLEADESDKSLLNYQTDSALVMNIGTDHYDKKELARIFREFVLKGKDGVFVLEDQAFLQMDPAALKNKNIQLFSQDFSAEKQLCGRKVRRLDSYSVRQGKVYCSFDGMPEICIPVPGRHHAVNALAVYTLLQELGYSSRAVLEAVENFHGVWRRFDYAGCITEKQVPLYDDYAHNVEKILSCLSGARSLCNGRLFALFQPHGFAPLKFMRQELFHALENFLDPEDRFMMLPVYYAGGTASFTPSSREVIQDYRSNSRIKKDCYRYADSRKEAEQWLCSKIRHGDIVLIMGARDNSLSLWAKELVRHTENL